MFLGTAAFAEFVRVLTRDYDVYAPRRHGDALVLERVSDGEGETEQIAWNPARLAESLKPLWFQPGKILSRWTEAGPEAGPRPRPRAILGAKSCDLQALAIIDRVFRDHEHTEPAWCLARAQSLIISGDCTTPHGSCFCTMLGHTPYPGEHFDLNLSPSEGGYLVEVGSLRGRELIVAHGDLFRKATQAELADRDEQRMIMETSVRDQNERYAVHDSFEKSVDKQGKTRLWDDLAATCVQCGACNLVCPTCHCFMLLDAKTYGGSARLSCWDSCFQSGYARMAGGGTPRLQLVERFKNHYHHKFVSFPRNWGITACSGCGRCVDACMGRIDKRECLHRLETEWLPSDVLEEVE